MFEYFVAMTVLVHSIKDEGRNLIHRKVHYIPAHNRNDAHEMCNVMSQLNSLHTKHGSRFERKFEVCVAVWGADDRRIYLPLHIIQRIAEEYTLPQAAE